MKDFPVFTTEYGVASLILREIPYRGDAYVIIQSSEDPEELLRECISFCRICGADRIYARGHEYLNNYEPHASVLEMRGQIEPDAEKIRCLWPVTEENIAVWRSKINERMKAVDHARTLDRKMESEILNSGGAYFIHHDDELLGAGWIQDDELMAITSFQKGAGECVFHTLLTATTERMLHLQVASSNTPAVRLYQRLGFLVTGAQQWYRVFRSHPCKIHKNKKIFL